MAGTVALSTAPLPAPDATTSSKPAEGLSIDAWSTRLPRLELGEVPVGTTELGSVGTIRVAISSDGKNTCLRAIHDDGSGSNLCAAPDEPTGYLDMTTNVDLEAGSPAETIVLLDKGIDFSIELVDAQGGSTPCTMSRFEVGQLAVWGCAFEEGTAAMRYIARSPDGATEAVLIEAFTTAG